MRCLHAVNPQFYPEKIGILLIGCFILALGAFLEVTANVVMLPADAFVNAVKQLLPFEFGTVRVISDVSMSVIAAAICLICMHKLNGVREGTVIGALLVGNISEIKTLASESVGRKESGGDSVHRNALPFENSAIKGVDADVAGRRRKR